MLVLAEEGHLLAGFSPGRGVNAEQSHLAAPFPVGAKKGADLIKQLGIELRRTRDRMGACDGGEVGVSEFQLNRAGFETVLAEAAPDLLAEVRQRGFHLRRVGGVLAVSVLV